MQKVLIVDDEASIREGMPYLIDWHEYGFEIIALAENGEIGLEKIRQQQPDIVIADIKMPGKTGLEMVQAAKEEGYSFYPIILSGYSDFQYAKKAIQLGATSYLLKPVDEEELIEILIKIKEEITSQSEEIKKQELIRKIFGKDRKGLTGVNYIKLARFLPSVKKEALQSIQMFEGIDWEFFYFQSYHYVVFTAKESSIDSEFERRLMKEVPNQEILITPWKEAKSGLNQFSEIIVDLAEYTFLFPGQLISLNQLEAVQKINQWTEKSIEQILATLVNGTNIQSALVAYQNNFYIEYKTEEQIKWQLNQEISWLIQQLKQKLLLESTFMMESIHQQIFQASNFPQLMHLLGEKIAELQQHLEKNLNRVDIVEEMMQYTRKYYHEDLSLKRIADYFNYNSAYLGKKFRRETNKTYLSFLEEVRMQKAGELLQNSNLMVYEVAEKVGYTNVDYFYKKFKNFYNVSPNEYRKG